MRKPDKEISKRLELFGLDARSVAFVDDVPENLDPVRAIGMTTVLYRSEGQVRDELAGAGVPVQRREVAATAGAGR